jgi:hypothetical protein
MHNQQYEHGSIQELKLYHEHCKRIKFCNALIRSLWDYQDVTTLQKEQTINNGSKIIKLKK